MFIFTKHRNNGDIVQYSYRKLAQDMTSPGMATDVWRHRY